MCVVEHKMAAKVKDSKPIVVLESCFQNINQIVMGCSSRWSVFWFDYLSQVTPGSVSEVTCEMLLAEETVY